MDFEKVFNEDLKKMVDSGFQMFLDYMEKVSNSYSVVVQTQCRYFHSAQHQCYASQPGIS